MDGPLEPTERDIPLGHYAAVEAALAEAFELADVLRVEGLSADAWADAAAAWKARLVQASKGEAGLFAAYKASLAEAEDRLGRRVDPLDDDLRAWASFLKCWSTHPSPFDLLTKLDLRMSDVSRLSRRWAARIASDPSLQSRAAELADEAKPDIPPLRLEPAKLTPSPYARRAELSPAPPPSPDEALLRALEASAATRPAVATLASSVLPFGPPDPDAIRHIPASSTPNPPTGTSPYVPLRRAPVLPFEGAEPPPLLIKDADINETSPFVKILTSPVLPFEPASPLPSSVAAPTSSILTLEQHASLTLELVLYPSRTHDILARYRITRLELDRLDADYRRRFSIDRALHHRWHEAYQTYYKWLSMVVLKPALGGA